MAASRLEDGSRPSAFSPIKYKGLFPSYMAPTSRAYCLMFSFFAGILMITMGSVFYHIIASHPMSGSRPMHTPPLPLALGLIICGLLTTLLCFYFLWKHGIDDSDEGFEDESYLVKDDVLEQNRFSSGPVQYACARDSRCPARHADDLHPV